MNQLVQLLRDAPNLVDDLVEGRDDDVSFGRIVDRLENVGPPRWLSADVAARATADPVVGNYVAEGFLGALDIEIWEVRLAEARPPRPGLPNEWVTFIPGARSGRGLTLPEDSSPEGRVALFTMVSDVVRRISIDRAGAPDASVSLALEPKCPLPTWAGCAAGQCGCVARRVVAPNGVVCECGDGTAA